MKAQCSKGHDLTETNVYIDPKGHPHCQVCRTDTMKRYRAAHRAAINAYQRARNAALPKRVRPTVAERFHAKCQSDATTGCVNWIGCLNPAGYGQFWNGTRYMPAHRWGYEEVKGKIPDGLVLDHLCRNSACVNPAHLEAVSVATNIWRGVSLWANNKKKTRCLNGHVFTPENTYIDPHGKRQCRACNRMRSWKLRHR